MSKTCDILHQWFNSLKKHTFPFNPREIPANGIYVLFEQGEASHATQRIVRVGTHTGPNQLLSRLQQHFLIENKDRSIFRKNIGRALLAKDHDPFLADWNIDLTPHHARINYAPIDREKLKTTEHRVSTYIQEAFSFIAFPVQNKEDRLTLESKIISTVSLCEDCGPSATWLGLSSPKEKIQRSGLWQVNELWKTPLTDADMEILHQLLTAK